MCAPPGACNLQQSGIWMATLAFAAAPRWERHYRGSLHLSSLAIHCDLSNQQLPVYHYALFYDDRVLALRHCLQYSMRNWYLHRHQLLAETVISNIIRGLWRTGRLWLSVYVLEVLEVVFAVSGARPRHRFACRWWNWWWRRCRRATVFVDGCCARAVLRHLTRNDDSCCGCSAITAALDTGTSRYCWQVYDITTHVHTQLHMQRVWETISFIIM